MMSWLSARPRTAVVALIAAALAFGGATLWRRAAIDDALMVPVRKGTLSARLTVSGTLKPVQSITYRSPLGGREAEVVSLVAEGTRVNEGDLLVRLDTSDLRRELERAVQEQRQARVDLQVADVQARVRQVHDDTARRLLPGHRFQHSHRASRLQRQPQAAGGAGDATGKHQIIRQQDSAHKFKSPPGHARRCGCAGNPPAVG